MENKIPHYFPICTKIGQESCKKMRKDIIFKAFDNIFERFKKAIPKWNDFVEVSFLPDEMKEAYQVMIDKKASQIGL